MGKGTDSLYFLLSLASRVLVFLLVIPVHESAHAWVAHKLGDDTAYKQGRVSLNPFVHLDLFGCVLMLLTGFGWAKPVPVNPSNMKNPRKGFALTALAGPLSNLLAAFVAALAFRIISVTGIGMSDPGTLAVEEVDKMYYVLLILEFFVEINVSLAAFNLIPLPPLDGFNVLRCFTGQKADRWIYAHQRQLSYGLLIFVVLMNRIPAFLNPLSYLITFFRYIIWKVVSFI